MAPTDLFTLDVLRDYLLIGAVAIINPKPPIRPGVGRGTTA